jgi:arylsulfatase A-like enzyme
VQWPGRLPAGTTYDQPVSSLDILATIAALAGAPDDPERPRDGVNLVPYLTGAKEGAPHDAIYLRKFDSQNYALRHGDYKFIRNGGVGTPGRLYNLARDIGEQNNLVMNFPEQARQCEDLLQAWVAELIEPRFLGLIHTPSWQAKVAREKKLKAEAGKAAKKKSAPAAEWDWFRAMDVDADASVTEAEWLAWGGANAARKGKDFDEETQREFFGNRDADGDGHLTREELDASNRSKK